MAVDDTESTSSLAEVGSDAPADDSRADVERAFDAIESRDAPPETPKEEAAPREDGRDALGRFSPKREATGETPAPTPPIPPAPPIPTTQPAAQPAAEQPPIPRHLAKPPASWAQAEAQHWDKTPLEVREAVARREQEVQKVMQEASSARNGLATLQQTIAPYVPNINAANGGDVVGAIRTFFEYDNRLRHGSQLEKARAAVQLIKGYGIDIGTLDTELAGAQHSPEQVQQDAVRAALQQELQPFREYMARQAQAEQQGYARMAEDVSEGLADFAAAHPYYDEVRVDMADMMQFAHQQGRRMPIEDAYERACWQNTDIRNKLIAGQQSAGAQAQHQAAQKARSAAVGVRNAPRAGAPGNGVMPENRSRADDIAAAFAAHAGEA